MEKRDQQRVQATMERLRQQIAYRKHLARTNPLMLLNDSEKSDFRLEMNRLKKEYDDNKGWMKDMTMKGWPCFIPIQIFDADRDYWKMLIEMGTQGNQSALNRLQPFLYARPSKFHASPSRTKTIKKQYYGGKK